ncbi:aminotransferase class V-fold PLP-dependent enzyme [Ichthyenterobacterium sp. W332]|uniref:Aminotransferase class V-fold PLP-dependent enzyme n=1 Tax=Microcosmobacter mediterraneus TaxID=3075607 RepID=A0ABU2YNM3_9FLAO|nr:aminotransferase class V-fold PLP-dependent enzyme [Ichthyenterobacterium sp. W332]MDT0558658.1 aminotransferase class V-fold PLP-dependent enzyme [Ichthyenterobacterium sp. W332]
MLQNQKHLFDIPEDVTYLNIASQSPAFKAIYEAGLEGLRQKQEPYRIRLSDYFEPVKELKQLFAKLVDADDYNRVVTIPSVSYGMATVAKNIAINEGDEILIVDEQFPSNYYAWKKLADANGAILKTIAHLKSNEQSVKQWNEDILNAISDTTAFVAMGNIHWSNGCLFNLKAIRKKTKKHNALLIIDGSQTIGVLPFSIKEIQPDALICAGYKWLFGPYGCAYAYYGSYFDHGTPIEENWSNRLNSENFAGLTNYESEYKPLANRYSVGESGNFIYVRMQIAALKQVIEWTPKAIQEYCKTISAEAVAELKRLGCKIENDDDRTHHLFGIELPENLDLHALKKDLFNRKIFVSFRGNYIRISCHLYNTPDDFKPLIHCLKSHV